MMKHLLLTTIAAVVLVGCGESQQSATDMSEISKLSSMTAKISIDKAAFVGNIEAVKQHLAAGTDVNQKGPNGMTPLHRAASEDYKDIAALLIGGGADVNAKDDDGLTPLHYASFKGQKEIAELLIAKVADVNAKGNDGTTPLDYAISRNHTEIADLLRKHGGKTGEELKAEGN